MITLMLSLMLMLIALLKGCQTNKNVLQLCAYASMGVAAARQPTFKLPSLVVVDFSCTPFTLTPPLPPHPTPLATLFLSFSVRSPSHLAAPF